MHKDQEEWLFCWGNYELTRQFVSINLTEISSKEVKIFVSIHFFNCYLAAPQPTLGHYWGGSLTHLMLITCVLHIRPKSHQESCSEVGSLSPAKYLVGFELGTFWFWLQCLNPLGCSYDKSLCLCHYGNMAHKQNLQIKLKQPLSKLQ